jgi:CXXX repeat peptide maturase
LLDIPGYKEEEFELYKSELNKIKEILISEYKKGNSFELNFLSDRILLNKMNNCNAGIDHVTFAPNGKFYICPGFYYEDEKDSIGTLAGDLNKSISIKNEQLFKLDHAPICSICDAFQCKRCVYLNKKVTLEVNTPSYQQCVLSHIERNFSRDILLTLKNTLGFYDFNNMPDIPEIDYLDPLKVVIGESKRAGLPINKNQPVQQVNAISSNTGIVMNQNFQNINPENMSTKDLLMEIYKMQMQILKEFNKR